MGASWDVQGKWSGGRWEQETGLERHEGQASEEVAQEVMAVDQVSLGQCGWTMSESWTLGMVLTEHLFCARLWGCSFGQDRSKSLPLAGSMFCLGETNN